jgi:hypothetical protein
MTRLADVARGKVKDRVSRFTYAVVSYPRDGADTDALMQAASNKLTDESEHVDL